jgi:predicted transcriptional regulator
LLPAIGGDVHFRLQLEVFRNIGRYWGGPTYCEILMMEESEQDNVLSLTAEIVSAYVSKNALPTGSLPELIGQIHQSLRGLATGQKSEPAAPLVPAVPVKKSVTPDYIVSLEDGRKFKSLKRHLSTHYNLTPAEYRKKWGLPSDYPMVAPNYAAARSQLAKSMGLGRKPKEAAPARRRAAAARAR